MTRSFDILQEEHKLECSGCMKQHPKQFSEWSQVTLSVVSQAGFTVLILSEKQEYSKTYQFMHYSFSGNVLCFTITVIKRHLNGSGGHNARSNPLSYCSTVYCIGIPQLPTDRVGFVWAKRMTRVVLIDSAPNRVQVNLHKAHRMAASHRLCHCGWNRRRA